MWLIRNILCMIAGTGKRERPVDNLARTEGTRTPQMTPRTRLAPRPQLADDVAAYVRDLIVSGQVRAGEFLRLENLAEQLGTSVTPVREALVSLRGEGFVTLQPRRGFMVSP